MKLTLNQPVIGLLLNEGTREAGSSVIDGKQIKWDSAYVITVMPYNGRRGDSVRKYAVIPEAVAEVSALLDPVGWGSLLELQVENNKVTDVKVLFDLTEYVPIN